MQPYLTKAQRHCVLITPGKVNNEELEKFISEIDVDGRMLMVIPAGWTATSITKYCQECNASVPEGRCFCPSCSSFGFKQFSNLME